MEKSETNNWHNCTESEPSLSHNIFFPSSPKFMAKLWVCSAHIFYYLALKLWGETLILFLTLSPHLPEVNFPDRSSPSHKFSLSALLAAFFISLFFFLWTLLSGCGRRSRGGAGQQPRSYFSETELPKPCNLFFFFFYSGMCLCWCSCVSSTVCNYSSSCSPTCFNPSLVVHIFISLIFGKRLFLFQALILNLTLPCSQNITNKIAPGLNH